MWIGPPIHSSQEVKHLLNLKSVFVALLGAIPWIALAEPSVVLDSNALSYKPGQQLTSRTTVTLQAGERLTLITESGGGVELIGPYSGPVSGTSKGQKPDVRTSAPVTKESQKQLETLVQRLTAQKAVDTSSLGVIRQPLAVVTKNSAQDMQVLLSEIPIGLNGKFCLRVQDLKRPGEKFRPRLRSQGKQRSPDMPLMLKAAAGQYVQLKPSGEQFAWEWPQKLPVKTGQRYLLREDQVSIPYVIELVGVNLQQEAKPMYAAAVLASKGCSWQAEALRVLNTSVGGV